MLFGKHLEEGVSEGALGALALSRYGHGLVCAWRCLVLDKVFEIVVVDIICMRRSVSGGFFVG